ncbi:MAG TPA: hypothetical protein VFK22_07565 [Candidatus Dormibacteraeota bacterium]|nr:hypothetical protein [Candidatus Dormibacteraeota bacterium]
MPASWVAASVRARLLAERRIGSARALDLTKCAGLPEALKVLAESPWGERIAGDMSLEEAEREVAVTLLWNLRLIAGWLPPGGVHTVQPLAAWFELSNIEERLVYLAGGGHPAPYQLGRLAFAWPSVARATTRDAVRGALAQSRWGDPGDGRTDAWMAILRFRWAAWVATSVPGADVWAAAASALLAARLRFTFQPAAEVGSTRPFGLPSEWMEASTVGELRALLSGQVAWVLDGIGDAGDLWRAEARWWSRVRRDAAKMLVASRFGPEVIVGAAALLAYDAWLTRAALAAVARGDVGRTVFSAVA